MAGEQLQQKVDAVVTAFAELIAFAVKAALAAQAKGAPPAAAEPEPETAAAAAPTRTRARKGAAAKKEVTYDEVRTALVALNDAKGKDAVIDLLAEFEATKIKELQETQYADVKTRAEELAAAEDSEGDEETDEEYLFG